MDSDFRLIKILSLGDQDTGKTCLIKRFCESKFESRYITTIGLDYGVKKLKIHGKNVAMSIFDLSGDPIYEAVRKEYYKDSQGV